MENKISANAISKDFPKFVSMVKKRLRAGAKAYGDVSFGRSPIELIDEIEQELFDVTGWAFILHHRLMKIKEATKRLTNDETNQG